MKVAETTPHQRINITLPVDIIRLVDHVAAKGDRSRFIAQAIRQYIGKSSRADLRRRIREGAIKRATRDLALAHEWFSVDEEAWRQHTR